MCTRMYALFVFVNVPKSMLVHEPNYTHLITDSNHVIVLKLFLITNISSRVENVL